MPSKQPSTEPSLPPIPLELVQHFDRLFPDRLPDLTATDRDMWAAIGAVRVVACMKKLFETQTGETYVQRERAKPPASQGGSGSRSTAQTG